jgi:hypothetical protein
VRLAVLDKLRQKIFNDVIGDRSRDLTPCSILPQPIMLLRAFLQLRDPVDPRNLDRRMKLSATRSWCKLWLQKSRQTKVFVNPPPPIITFRSSTEIICCRPGKELRNYNQILKADKTELNCRVVKQVSGSKTVALSKGYSREP